MFNNKNNNMSENVSCRSNSSNNNNICELLLQDPETQQTYKLLLNSVDYKRATSDDNFAASLLLHAQREVMAINSEHEEGDEIYEQGEVDLEDELPQLESSNNSKVVYTWGYKETLLLISSMGSYVEDFNHPRKRKHVFEMLTNDLVSHGYSVTITMVQNKWKSLTRSYNKAKDNKNRTGQGPNRFQFYENMDEILGDKPTNSCHHSLNSSENIPEVKEAQSADVEEQKSEENSEKNEKKCEESGNQRIGKNKLKKEYIAIKERQLKAKEKRHQDKMQVEKERMEIERKKIKLLEEYLHKK